MTTTEKSRRALALCALLACTSAHAEGNWLLGGSVGTSHIDETVDSVRIDSDSTTVRFYGGYRFNDHLAVEFGYLRFGRFEDALQIVGTPVAVTAEAEGFTMSVAGTAPVTERLSLHGTIGSFFWNGKTSLNGITDSPGDTNLFFGAGASFSLTPMLALRADAARYELDEIDANVFSIGLQFDFK